MEALLEPLMEVLHEPLMAPIHDEKQIPDPMDLPDQIINDLIVIAPMDLIFIQVTAVAIILISISNKRVLTTVHE